MTDWGLLRLLPSEYLRAMITSSQTHRDWASAAENELDEREDERG